MKVLIETDTEEIVEDVKADSRGRITLGKEYANAVVSVAVVNENKEDN